jgi:hypothetical protein
MQERLQFVPIAKPLHHATNLQRYPNPIGKISILSDLKDWLLMPFSCRPASERSILEPVVHFPRVVDCSQRAQAGSTNRAETFQPGEPGEPSTHDRIAKQHL